MTDTPTRTNAPTLSWAVRLLSLEAVALGGLVVFVIWKAIDGSAASTKTRIGIPIAVVLCVVIVAGLARALSHLKPWARGPAIVIEMLLIPIGYYMATGGLGYIGILVLMAGLFGAGLLLAPSTRTALGIDRYSDR